MRDLQVLFNLKTIPAFLPTRTRQSLHGDGHEARLGETRIVVTRVCLLTLFVVAKNAAGLTCAINIIVSGLFAIRESSRNMSTKSKFRIQYSHPNSYQAKEIQLDNPRITFVVRARKTVTGSTSSPVSLV